MEMWIYILMEMWIYICTMYSVDIVEKWYADNTLEGTDLMYTWRDWLRKVFTCKCTFYTIAHVCTYISHKCTVIRRRTWLENKTLLKILHQNPTKHFLTDWLFCGPHFHTGMGPVQTYMYISSGTCTYVSI